MLIKKSAIHYQKLSMVIYEQAVTMPVKEG